MTKTQWVHINERLPTPGQTNLIVWCGWAEPAVYLPKRGQKRAFFSEPARVNPIFHVTYWTEITPPEEQEYTQ